jgi:hypothetical protein
MILNIIEIEVINLGAFNIVASGDTFFIAAFILESL